MDEAPESKTEKVAVSVTPREKLAIQLVAARHATDSSNLIRVRVLEAIREEAEEIRESLNRQRVAV